MKITVKPKHNEHGFYTKLCEDYQEIEKIFSHIQQYSITSRQNEIFLECFVELDVFDVNWLKLGNLLPWDSVILILGQKNEAEFSIKCIKEVMLTQPPIHKKKNTEARFVLQFERLFTIDFDK